MSCMADVHEVQEANDKSKFHRHIKIFLGSARISNCCVRQTDGEATNTDIRKTAANQYGQVRPLSLLIASDGQRDQQNIVHVIEQNKASSLVNSEISIPHLCLRSG